MSLRCDKQLKLRNSLRPMHTALPTPLNLQLVLSEPLLSLNVSTPVPLPPPARPV